MVDWRLRAACNGLNPEMWFQGYDTSKAAKAKHICRWHCTVRTECYEFFAERAVGGMVAGGEHWVTVKGSGGKQVKASVRTPSKSKGCPICWGVS